MPQKILDRPCPCCGHTMGLVHTHVEFAPIESEHLPTGFDVCTCAQCGMAFDDLKATQQDFDNYYASTAKYISPDTAGSGGFSTIDNVRWKRMEEIITPHLQKDSVILDLGCGHGGFLQHMKSLGYHDVFGIEPSMQNDDSIKIDNGIHIYSTVKEFTLQRLKANCIIISHVLEHVFDLKSFFYNITELLSHNGFIYIEVPDAKTYGELNHPPFYYFDREHINHFTIVSLNNFMNTINFYPLGYAMHGYIEARKYFYNSFIASLFKIDISNNKNLIYDEEGVSNINSYCLISNTNESKNILPDNMPVFFWGLGAHLRRIIMRPEIQALDIRGIIDRDRGNSGEFFAGYPVLSPSILRERERERERCSIIISSVLYKNEIAADCKKIAPTFPLFYLS